MNRYLFLMLMALAIGACNTPKQTTAPAAVPTLAEDSTEYEILIMDSEFDVWYTLNYSPAKDRTNDYYRYKNWVAVENWNDYYRNGRYSLVISASINYWPNIDYGIDVNRKLYWYFRYVRNTFKIPLF